VTLIYTQTVDHLEALSLLSWNLCTSLQQVAMGHICAPKDRWYVETTRLTRLVW
jgi:hypothetical protein